MVLEEYPGELKQLRDFDAAQDRKRGERLEPTARAAVGRLVAEGAKAGVRVLLLAQRADAEFIDGASRSNFAARVSFRVDNADAVRMLLSRQRPSRSRRSRRCHRASERAAFRDRTWSSSRATT